MILLIDNYDSFVFNVEQYLKELTNEEVKTVRNDEITLEGIKELNPDRIVLSPGPKHPKDSGICLEILKNIDNIPILGICLGHQAFGLVFGGKIERLETPLHGKTSEITVTDKNSILFKMADKMEIERVNSFHHQALKQVAKGLKVVATAPDGIIEAVEAENEDGTFILGVQFHPEMMFDKSTFARGIFKKFISICIESKPGEVILKDELHHIEENEEKNIDEKIKEIEDEEKKEFFKGDL
mgnify:CR=1 FL=1